MKLPRGLEALADEVFEDCAALEEIILPEGLKSIGEESFFGCGELKEIRLPDALERVGRDAFAACGKLKNISCRNKTLLTAENIRNSPYGEKHGVCSHCGGKLGLLGGCGRCKKPRKYR